ncbi:MAG: adenylate/guanylate cyclase domain-containing protein, partial [Rhizobiaceae bacterium]
AVLAADVVGYSRLMSDDTERTLDNLQGLRGEIIGPAIAANRGTLVKSLGDGWIVAFDVVDGAVRCAMQIQDRLKVDSFLKLRMGIHAGDITKVHEDVFGDGINVAARLETMAEPGALVISGAVRDMLDGTLRPSFDAAGKQQLKNIPEPVSIWVRGGDIAGGKRALESDGWPRLAIIPIITHDPRDDVQDLAMALTGDLCTHLSAFRYLKSRTTQNPDQDEYQLRGFLRAYENEIRLETKLTTPNRAEILATKFDGDLSDSFHWQDKTGLALGRDTLNRVLAFEVSNFSQLENEQCTAVQLILKLIVLGATDGPGLGLMTELASLAINKEPEWGTAYAYALGLIALALTNGSRRYVESYIPSLPHWQEKVDQLEPPYSPARIILALSKLVQSGDRQQARRDVRLVMRNLPFDPEALHWASWVYAFSDDPQEALSCLDQLDRSVQPQHAMPSIANARAMVHLLVGEYETAIDNTRRAAELSPNDVGCYLIEAASLALADHLKQAKEAMSKVLRLAPEFSMYQAGWRQGRTYSPSIRQYYNGLRKAGLPQNELKTKSRN